MRRMAAAAWLLQIMLFGLCITAGSAHAADDEARVLILNGTDPYLPAYLEIDRAMRVGLAQETGRRVVYFSEPLDAQRFQVEAYEPELVALLAKKYAGLRFDVVVAISERALDFFNLYGAQLWPGARLVFSGWPGEVFESSSGLPPDAAAVVADVDVRETFELARRLQPNARRLVMVSGASDLDRRNERRGATGASRTARTGCPSSISPVCLCQNWSPAWPLSPRIRLSSTSHNFATARADRIRRARCCVRSVPDPSAPVYGMAKPTLASAWWPALRNRMKNMAS